MKDKGMKIFAFRIVSNELRSGSLLIVDTISGAAIQYRSEPLLSTVQDGYTRADVFRFRSH